MNRIKHCLVFSAATLLLQCALIPASTTQVQAQNASSKETASGGKRSNVAFKSRKGERAPKTAVGGGRRNNGMCESGVADSIGVKSQTVDKTLVPLLPSSKLGFTASSHPSFMVYVPATSAKALEFTLENEEGEGIYQTEVNIDKAPGIVSFTLPQTEAALEKDKDYRFIVSMICQQAGPKNPFAEGLVRRISLDSALVNQLNKPQSLEQVILYSESGYWFEAIENLAALKRSQPNDLEVAAAWENLLASVGLDGIGKAELQN